MPARVFRAARMSLLVHCLNGASSWKSTVPKVSALPLPQRFRKRTSAPSLLNCSSTSVVEVGFGPAAAERWDDSCHAAQSFASTRQPPPSALSFPNVTEVRWTQSRLNGVTTWYGSASYCENVSFPGSHETASWWWKSTNQRLSF